MNADAVTQCVIGNDEINAANEETKSIPFLLMVASPICRALQQIQIDNEMRFSRIVDLLLELPDCNLPCTKCEFYRNPCVCVCAAIISDLIRCSCCPMITNCNSTPFRICQAYETTSIYIS